ncbi:MAG TPA: hypothetical protein PKD12_09975 [Nitrospira sp.]|nr:hypothetical protein [Nitrospira sp.]
MAIRIERATEIQAAGNKPKLVDEFIGRVNSNTRSVSVTRMQSPTGWQAPGQTSEFDEYTVVLRGMLCVEIAQGVLAVCGKTLRSSFENLRTNGAAIEAIEVFRSC